MERAPRGDGRLRRQQQQAWPPGYQMAAAVQAQNSLSGILHHPPPQAVTPIWRGYAQHWQGASLLAAVAQPQDFASASQGILPRPPQAGVPIMHAPGYHAAAQETFPQTPGHYYPSFQQPPPAAAAAAFQEPVQVAYSSAKRGRDELDEYAAPTLPPRQRQRYFQQEAPAELSDGNGYGDEDEINHNDGSEAADLVACYRSSNLRPSRIVRIYPGEFDLEVPEEVTNTAHLWALLKSMGCDWFRSDGTFRSLSEHYILKPLPPKFTFEVFAIQKQLSNMDLQQQQQPVSRRDSSARTELRASAMDSSRVSIEACPEEVLWDEQIVRRQVPRMAVPVDELLSPLRPLVAELRYLHFLRFEAREASLEKVMQMRRGRTANQDDKEVVYHPLFLQFCRGAASGQPGIKFDKQEDPREGIRVLATGTSQPSELRATFRCAEQGDVTGGIDSNALPFAKMLKCNTKDPRPWHLGIFGERIERVWFALFTYGSGGEVESLTVAPAFPVSKPRDLTQVWDRKNLLFDISRLDKVKKPNPLLQEVVPRCPEPGFKLLVRYVDSLCSRLNIELATIELVRHDGHRVKIDGAKIIGSGGKSVVLQMPGEAAVYKVSGKTRIEKETSIHAFVDGLPCIRPMLAPELFGEVRGAGEGLSWLALAGFGRELHRGDVESRYEALWNDGERAVHSMHQRGVLHRDIKPANFLIFGHELQLNDFDVSCFPATVPLDVLRQRVGTPYFDSPLFDEEKGYQYRDDWCSLVLSFLHLRNAYDGTDGMAAMEKALGWLNVPDGMRECIRWITSPDAADGRKRELLVKIKMEEGEAKTEDQIKYECLS